MCGGGTGACYSEPMSPLSYDGIVARREREPMNRSGWNGSSGARQHSCWYKTRVRVRSEVTQDGVPGVSHRSIGVCPSRSELMRSWTRGASASPRADEHVVICSLLVTVPPIRSMYTSVWASHHDGGHEAVETVVRDAQPCTGEAVAMVTTCTMCHVTSYPGPCGFGWWSFWHPFYNMGYIE
jgi:hypothetical protein